MAEETKLHVDDDWKSQAEKEKEKLAGTASTHKPAPRHGAIPPATFSLMVQQFTTQAMMAFGVIQHPITQKAERDLEAAKHYIDMLGVLAEKTKGNLTAEEQKLLDATLYELRMTYVEMTKKA
jgi:hypothetical protein